MGNHAGFCVGLAVVGLMLVVMGILGLYQHHLDWENEFLAAKIQKYKCIKKVTDSLLHLTGNFLREFPVINRFMNPFTSSDALVPAYHEETPKPWRVPFLDTLITNRLQK